MKKKYFDEDNFNENDFENYSFEELEDKLEDLEDIEIYDEMYDYSDDEIPKVDLLNDVFEGDIDLYTNYLDG